MKTKPIYLYKKLILILVLAILYAFMLGKALAEEATSLSIELTNSNGKGYGNLRDNSYSTSVKYSAGDTISITTETPMTGIYIVWGNKDVPSWKLTVNDKTKECGTKGFLHEYVSFDGESTSCTLTIANDCTMLELKVFSKGDLPADVQTWDEPCDKADLLVFSTHADDEILFLGGPIVKYAGQEKLKVQVVYLCHYWSGPYGAPVREHEKLDGLWHAGVRNYPVNMPFEDQYCTSLESAEKIYDISKIKESITENIRRFKPQIAVTQDFNGEYGHGGHMILAKALSESVKTSNDESVYTESVGKYGVWDVAKTYIHLYGENKIKLDLRQPLSNMGNKTALEIAKEAYKKHVSQQGYWFYVSDDNQYSCAEFGLYRTTVGDDVNKNDMMENIVSYAEQDRIAAEKAEEEAKKKAEEEAKKQAEEAEKNKQELQGTPTKEAEITQPAGGSNPSSDTTPSAAKKEKGSSKLVYVVIVLLLIGVAVIAALIVNGQRRINEKRRKLERMRRQRARNSSRPSNNRSTDSRPSNSRPTSSRPSSNRPSVNRDKAGRPASSTTKNRRK